MNNDLNLLKTKLKRFRIIKNITLFIDILLIIFTLAIFVSDYYKASTVILLLIIISIVFLIHAFFKHKYINLYNDIKDIEKIRTAINSSNTQK